jgi:hypothetical protein
LAEFKREIVPETRCRVRYGSVGELEMASDRGSRKSETGG